jgi:ATP-binding cassette subfamily G (WHITE) protein 1
MYGLVPYFMTKNLLEQPALLLQPLVTLLVVFWGVGFNNSFETFARMWLILMLLCQCGSALGFMISASVDSIQKASALSSAVTLPSILFGGLFVQNSSVFRELSWIQWLSPVRYAFEGTVISEF